MRLEDFAAIRDDLRSQLEQITRAIHTGGQTGEYGPLWKPIVADLNRMAEALKHNRVNVFRPDLLERVNSFLDYLRMRAETLEQEFRVQAGGGESLDITVVNNLLFSFNRAFGRMVDEAEVRFQLEAVDIDVSALRVQIDPGSAPAEVIADILSDISILYRRMGGSGIDFTPHGVRMLAGGGE